MSESADSFLPNCLDYHLISSLNFDHFPFPCWKSLCMIFIPYKPDHHHEPRFLIAVCVLGTEILSVPWVWLSCSHSRSFCVRNPVLKDRVVCTRFRTALSPLHSFWECSLFVHMLDLRSIPALKSLFLYQRIPSVRKHLCTVGWGERDCFGT